MRDHDSYDQFDAAELFCPTCKRANPVRKHLLIVLPDGNKYDYRCAVCGTSVGSKMDDDTSAFRVLLPK